MRGKPAKQAKTLLSQILHLGQSRHQAKKEARQFLESRGLPTDSHTVARHLGIHSTGSYGKYLMIVEQFIRYVSDEFGVTDSMRITEEHAAAFITNSARKNAFSTVQTQCAALEKMCVGMEKLSRQLKVQGKIDYVQKYEWTRSFDNIKAQKRALEIKKTGDIIRPAPRAYDAPHVFVEKLTGDFKTAAQLQLLCGARVGEIKYLKKSQLNGRELRLIKTKGGRPRVIKLPVDLKDRLDRAFKRDRNNPFFEIDQRNYSRALQKVVAETPGEEWHGTHGLRWNYAQNRVSELRQTHMPKETANIVSRELGHSREDITNWYLRR